MNIFFLNTKKFTLAGLLGVALFHSHIVFAQDAPTVETPPETQPATDAEPLNDQSDEAGDSAPAPKAEEKEKAVEEGEGVAATDEPKAADEVDPELLVAVTPEGSEAQEEKAPLPLEPTVHQYGYGHSTYPKEELLIPTLPANAQLFMKNHLHVYGISGWTSELGFTVGSMAGQGVGAVLFDGSGSPSSVGIGYQTARPGVFIAGNRDIRLSLSLPNLRAMAYYWWRKTGGIFSVQSTLLGATLTGDRGFKWYVNLAPLGASAWLAYEPDLSGPVYSVAMDFTTEVGIWW